MTAVTLLSKFLIGPLAYRRITDSDTLYRADGGPLAHRSAACQRRTDSLPMCKMLMGRQRLPTEDR
jgi:hypothetical protein